MLLVGRRLVHALKRHAERFVVFLLQQGDQEMRRLRVENYIIEQARLPKDEARHLPAGPHPNAGHLVRIVPCQGLEEVRLVIEEPVFKMDGEGYRVQHEPRWLGEVVHHLEHIVLIENVLGGAVVGDEAVLTDMLRRARVEVEIERDGIELRIEIDAMISKPERGIELQSGALPIREPVEHVRGRGRLAECLEQVLHQAGLWTPYVLRPEFHHIRDALENAQSFELAVQGQYWWTQAHTFSPFSFRAQNGTSPTVAREMGHAPRSQSQFSQSRLDVWRSHTCEWVSGLKPLPASIESKTGAECELPTPTGVPGRTNR